MCESSCRDFEAHLEAEADAEASETVPKQSSTLRKGDFVILRGHPCKVVEMNTSQPGKHGHAKIRITGFDMFTGKRHEDLCPAGQNIQVPVVKKREYRLVEILDEGKLVLSDLVSGETRSDQKCPGGEMEKHLRSTVDKAELGVLVTLGNAMGQTCVMGFKKIPKGAKYR